MQNGIISNEQLSGPGTGRQYARLFNFERGMYRYKTKGINLIIDLEYPKVSRLWRYKVILGVI